MLSLVLGTQSFYDEAQMAVIGLVDAGNFKEAREAIEGLKDPYWRSIVFSKIAKVTRETQDLQAALAAARANGISWWRSIALSSLVGVFAEAQDFEAAGAVLEEVEDSFWRAAARKRIAQAQRR